MKHGAYSEKREGEKVREKKRNATSINIRYIIFHYHDIPFH